MQICRRYAPVVEKFSIDECFLDMTGTVNLPSSNRGYQAAWDAIRESWGSR